MDYRWIRCGMPAFFSLSNDSLFRGTKQINDLVYGDRYKTEYRKGECRSRSTLPLVVKEPSDHSPEPAIVHPFKTLG
nr:MAG TPA: hypothetical protein [Caudoviricetes sp.]